ncbi:hypothetical protein DM867_10380 [Halosegnis rubeus]|jgi:hypothetical protein|uniref:DUF7312 domain-containing protein n=1 Tax=Halosegnis rubeus TaxID=2212850 RepID=A0A5N5UFX5_9EURY|nr:hypothetical protein [Halosegnis rubeus]KAB7513377.1 hypothetical protein DM867_10380 [Halosegnis rubeus]KAB7517360.1 hypothetical protein DP108_10125 [Halosegnis rubeus]KAB7518407.1 hypothetical protein DMP03_03355 [Halosegnis rubeus]
MTDDEREWDDPPGVWDDEEDDGADEADDAGALNVATEGESFVRSDERDPITPGDISAEHAAFVLLGALFTTLVLVRLASGVL